MSAIRLVTELIDERGSGTVDDLMPEIDGYTRQQVLNALQNAAAIGLITCDGRRPPQKGSRLAKPGTYRTKKTEPTMRRRPVSSVWQLGACAGTT